MASPSISRWVALVWAVSATLTWASAASTALRPWNDYQVILWVNDTAFQDAQRFPVFLDRIREMGVTAGMVYGSADPQPFVSHRFPYYVENIVNRGLCLKWNAQVRDWEKFVTAWHKSRDEVSLVREYCLDDPTWLNWAKQEMRAAAKRHQIHQPLAYDIRDELSVTLSANPFDYDFSPAALRGFREWLRTQYADLNQVNRQWDTTFTGWDEVRPFTTDQIKARLSQGSPATNALGLPDRAPDWSAVQRVQFKADVLQRDPARWNFSPWCDFRTYMDLSLARTLDLLRQSAHEIDPATPVGIEGTQMPHAFGGYDLWRLSQVLDWIEPYDIGNAREILGSFMPTQPILTTVFETDTQKASRRLWHLLLQGDRGCLIWWSEDCLDWKSPNLALTPKAKALAPVLKEMTGPLAKLFLQAERVYDPIAILYSQPSIQVDWLIESCPDGATWLRRFSSFEAEHNHQAKIRNGWLKALQDAGYSPKFISSEQLATGILRRDHYRALVLPNALSLSDLECQRIREFLEIRDPAGSTAVLGDGCPGLFDEHGKPRPSPLFGKESFSGDNSIRAFCRRFPNRSEVLEAKVGDIADYAADRLRPKPVSDWPQWIRRCLTASGLPSVPVSLELIDTASILPRVAIYRYRLGQTQILAFEPNIEYQMSEDLKQGGGNQHLENPLELGAKTTQTNTVYDLRKGQDLGRTSAWIMSLSPWKPAIYALIPEGMEGDKKISALVHPKAP